MPPLTAVHELPTGTVTFLFTDIEGSTRLLREHGAAYSELLAEHRDLLRAVFARHGGVEVDTQGDAFFVAFLRPSDAAAAAAAAQKALEQGPVRVRIGVHTGEAVVTEEGYVGVDINRAARLMSAAHGGQIVLSERTRSFLDDKPLIDLGLHRLKDLGRAERIYQLGDGDFPPLRTVDATNLPVAASPLLGREKELAELVALASDGARLLTITGPGGTGKTRLGLQVADELVGAVKDGVFWVPLAGVSDPDLVVPEIAHALGAREDLAGYLRGRQIVLLLDTFEHVLPAAPALAALLAGAEGLRLLATSRAPLRVAGEREYALDPLSVKDAMTLFIERAREVGRDVGPTAAVGEICRRVDGLPLAIELAAARTKLLTPEALLDRLESALPLLTAGARDAPERQRTLRATIQWSYDLLDRDGCHAFALLSVFAGSFSLAAAEEVSRADLDAIASLADLSLLKPIGDDRLLMLDTIREYAAERLAESPDAREAHRRHAAFFASLAEQGYERRLVAEAEWAARLELDHDNLRAALDWLLANDSGVGLELGGALGWFWLSRSHLAEGERRLAEALQRSQAGGSARARALTAAGALAGWQGDTERGREQLTEAMSAWQALDDVPELALALDALGWTLFFGGQDSGSLEAFERSLELWRDLDDRPGQTRSLVGVCQVLIALGEVERAETLSRELLQRAGTDDLRSQHFAFHFLADCALIRGDFEEAEGRYRESLHAALAIGDVFETSFEVQGVAMAAAAMGHHARATRLAAAVDALWESLGTSVSIPFWDALLTRHLGAARRGLDAEYDSVWAEGRELPFDDAVALALKPS